MARSLSYLKVIFNLRAIPGVIGVAIMGAAVLFVWGQMGWGFLVLGVAVLLFVLSLVFRGK